MSCGCSNKQSCSCASGFSTESLESQEFNAQLYPEVKKFMSGAGCESNKGRFYDLVLEDFIMPEVGGEAYLKVCDGSLWKKGMYVGAILSGNKIAAFIITEVGTRKLKVLNGCDKSGDSPFLGNPEKGSKIANKTIIFPIPPTGCETGFAQSVLSVLESSGGQTALESIISQLDNICFTTIPDIGEDESGHLFAGTKPDCDCAEEDYSSCLRKVKDITIAEGGKYFCFPEIPIIDSLPINGQQKRLALFEPETGCLKAGPTIADLKSCDDNSGINKDNTFDAVSACNEGIPANLLPTSKHLEITTVEIDDPESDAVPPSKIIKWIHRNKKYAIVQHTTGSGVDGGATTIGSWNIRPMTLTSSVPAGFVTVASNIITINSPGLYEIEFTGTLFAASGGQLRLESTTGTSEIIYSNTGYTTNDSYHTAYAIIEITEATKSFKMSYRVATANATDGLGKSLSFGAPNIYTTLKIKSL